MTVGKARAHTGMYGIPASVSASFETDKIYTRLFDSELTLDYIEAMDKLYPKELYVTIRDIKTDWLLGQKVTLAQERVESNGEVSVMTQNGRRFYVGSRHLLPPKIDEWIERHFGVRPLRISN